MTTETITTTDEGQNGNNEEGRARTYDAERHLPIVTPVLRPDQLGTAIASRSSRPEVGYTETRASSSMDVRPAATFGNRRG